MTVSDPTSAPDVAASPIFDPPVGRLSTLRYARGFGLAFVLLAIVLGGVSFLVLLGLTPIEPTFNVIIGFLIVNTLVVGLLVFLVGREIYALIQSRRRGRAAARMHIRIVGLFAIVASFPAILVAIVAGITLDLGLDRVFSDRSRSIVDNSISVAEAYVNEATTALNTHAVDMGRFLGSAQMRSYFILDRRAFRGLMTGQAKARGLLSAAVVRPNGSEVMVADLPNAARRLPTEIRLIEVASDGKPACTLPRTRNVSMCAFKLENLDGEYFFYVQGNVNPTVLNSIQLMRELTAEYERLESGRLPLQIAFALLYVGVCFTILLSAIWMGIAVADRLVDPIRRLINAADQVAAGDLNVSVPHFRTEGELRSLTNTFNSMTSELRSQRDEILSTQTQIDNRRRFTEAVLSGVPAGVVGLDTQGVVSIANPAAVALLGGRSKAPMGKALDALSPELASVVKKAQTARTGEAREQIVLMRKGKERTLNVQVAVDTSSDSERSSVITFDDITDLVSAQRTSAWADVARRIAHEIKNPLTPIQLSAERIRRRYGKRITEDREVFDQCTETIIRQVADIGRMVDEFSSFARMPKPAMVEGNLADPLREAVFLLKVGHPEITFDVELGDAPLNARFDSRLLGQAFGNLIKNATEAMESVEFVGDDKPIIQVRTSEGEETHIVEIIDNGKGLPEQHRQRLLEPYMTTREKGTGLGLAIVGKILEEHGGTIELLDAPQVADGGRGAMVRVTLPKRGVSDVVESDPADAEEAMSESSSEA
ncbi:MAG: PAS domain-containing sensor histidine kinase [Pseudomonadota bacterium]